MNTPVTVVGEALIDIVVSPDGRIAEHVGGSPANVAIGLARLGHGTTLITHIGVDERGQRIADLLASEHVLLSLGSRSADQTPTATATLDTTGAATYEFDLAWRPDDTAVAETGHLHTGSIAATLAPGAAIVRRIVESARTRSTVSYDPNVRPSLMDTPAAARATIEATVALADVVKASDEDLHWLYPGIPEAEVMRTWTNLGPRLCIITHGGDDVVAAVGNDLHRVPVTATEVVDTVGAGDSFMAGLLSGLLDAGLLGGPDARTQLSTANWEQILPAVLRGIACSAITVSRAGANPPTRANLREHP